MFIWIVILWDINSKKHKITNCSQLKVNLALSSCPLGFLTNHNGLTQLDVVCKDPEDQSSGAMSDQGKGIPNLMALCGKCLTSCNSDLESKCVLGDVTWRTATNAMVTRQPEASEAPAQHLALDAFWWIWVYTCECCWGTRQEEARILWIALEGMGSSWSSATTWL